MPYTRTPDLPLFERPPVTEVNIGIQFQNVRIRAVDLGKLHELFADRYPVVEEVPPSPQQIEFFGSRMNAGVKFDVMDRIPLPRLVFLAEDRSSLVQVQEYGFHCAWRQASNSTTYPRYSVLRSEFVSNISLFADFVVDAETIQTTQAEISYVNHIGLVDVQRSDIMVGGLPTLAGASDSELSAISAVGTAQHFTFRNNDGIDYARLHIVSEQVVSDLEPHLRLTFVYRGEPHESSSSGPGLRSIMHFFDEGHDRIVGAFAANTTPEAQVRWGRVA